MTKPGLTEDKVDGLLAGAASGPGWALCVGAGTSLPAFPDWNRLVRRLIESCNPSDVDRVSKDLSGVFSADALIQAAAVRSGRDANGFAQLLTEELYRDFLGGFEGSDRRTVLRALGAVRPGDLSQHIWRRFLELMHARWGDRMSALAIAPILSDALGTPRSPAAILSFNAEPLLFAVLTAYQACNGDEDAGVPQRIDRVVRGISNRSVDRVPYVFCHGLLPVPGAETTQHAASPDKLVFSEAAYLQLAGNVYSWQATSFLETCSARRVVFVGLSLSDANMRRWLSWIHDSRMDELEQVGQRGAISTQHLWLNLDPGDAEVRAWIEASVAHLGVRLVWLRSWGSMGPVLGRMLRSSA
ncbi:SIR2 family protein [Paraliomyxa miuraensis]|uniref:SIR2 family protein n=1 Tax=Paraliomyxa miuraensis TaxID=376150 RepID=UPI002252CC3A|nr:SIR2 family protein [Paraliomyxa miuraensis]MCX4243825.1 SIR2 family protein [Paraliomyxa miuraensis]